MALDALLGCPYSRLFEVVDLHQVGQGERGEGVEAGVQRETETECQMTSDGAGCKRLWNLCE